MNSEEERRGLMKFVPPNFLPIAVLVVEAEEFLSDVRRILPAAKIALFKAEPSPEVKIFMQAFTGVGIFFSFCIAAPSFQSDS